MGYGPAHRVGGPKKFWDFRVYGLSESWVKRVLTVESSRNYIQITDQLVPGSLFANEDADSDRRLVRFLAFHSLLFACTSENKQIGKLLMPLTWELLSLGITSDRLLCSHLAFDMKFTGPMKGINKMVKYPEYLPFDSVNTSECSPMADPTTTTYSHVLLVPFFPFGEYLCDGRHPHNRT